MKVFAAIAALALSSGVGWQVPVSRPRILGISHVGFHVSDMAKARTFYGNLLGFSETVRLPGAGSRPEVVVVRINDRQWVELFGSPGTGEGQLHHVALETDDVRGMRAYVMGRGAMEVSPVGKGPTGHEQFFLTDPDGHRIEFVQSGRQGPSTAPSKPGISDRALHAGILVGELARANAFYRGTLGFEELWRGSAVNSTTLSWVNMRVPDGTDYLEFMLYAEKPAPDRRGSAHHLCLLVPDAASAVAALEANPARTEYARAIEIRTGVNRKRQVNLFDPDGTRIELMEPNTIDGIPAPSSTLPPPR
jgi:catechol 2,3-dioxygenase-like lactoylglutathione lyase family enzyme